MSEGFWTVVFGVGIAQGAFLIVSLLLRQRTNPRATRILAGLVTVLTVMILSEVLERELQPPLALLIAFLNANTELAIGPLIYLFFRSILEPHRPLRRGDLLHFAPIVLGLAGWGTAWALLVESPSIDQLPALGYYVLLKACVLAAYGIATYRQLVRALTESRRSSGASRTLRLEWLRRWLLGLTAVPCAIYLSVFLEHRGIELLIEPDQLGSLLLTGAIHLVALMLILRPWVLSLTARPLRANAWAREVARLSSFLERERPWLEPELSLGELAQSIGSTERRLTDVLNEGLGTSFYALINRCRLSEFERLARDPALRNRAVLDLAFDAGFNSKASFYRAFREIHDTTPGAFRKSL